MSQSTEIASKHGFQPGEDTHLLWSIKERIKGIESDVRHHAKMGRKLRSQRKYAVAHNHDVTIDKEVRACNELIALVRMLTSGPPFPKNFSQGEWFEEPYWYCCRCGILDPEEVTVDEKCSNCGGDLPI